MRLRVQNRSCNVASPRQLQRSGALCSSAVRSLHEDAVDDVGFVLETTFGETFPDSSDSISAKLPWSVQFRNDNIARRNKFKQDSWGDFVAYTSWRHGAPVCPVKPCAGLLLRAETIRCMSKCRSHRRHRSGGGVSQSRMVRK